MSPVKFTEISRFSDEFVKLKTFAKSFDHNINPFGSARVYDLSKNGMTFGYCDVVHLPVFFPAFHPEVTRPRDIVESLIGLQHHCQIVSAGEGFVGVPIDAERKTFPTEMLEKHGFFRMKREIYALNP